MKKFKIGILLISALLILSACSAQTAPASETAVETSQYVDGTYEAAGDAWDFGHEEVSLVIKDDRIESLVFSRIDLEGNEIDYKAYKEMGGPDLAAAREQLANAVIETQSSDVEVISGATVSSGNWKVAVDRALDQAENK